ncbi:hypothetical protein GCM10009574_067260 [Streptomyces asiaticus]|uniref:Uncharacterized protein n=2 Tax=Streptomyces rhizosphaericus TaxID=114699 RepID=A0ABN1PES7_9ACTN
MKSQDGLDQVSDARGAAAEFAKEPPGPEAGHGLFAERPDLCVRAVNGLLTCGEFLPSSSVGHADSPVGACLPEWKGRSAAIRSVGSSVPSRITNALADAAWVAADRSGASAASSETASVT